MGIIESFEPTIEVELPETLKDVASTLGSIAESPIENFKVIEMFSDGTFSHAISLVQIDK